MMQTQDELLEHYQNFDLSSAKKVEPRLIKKIQDLKGQQQYHPPFDDDVISWLSNQNDETKRHINDMIRHAMALQNVKPA